MSTIPSPERKIAGSLLLANGDRLLQPEFHRRYQSYPEDVKIELVGGTVYVASPVGWLHGRYQLLLATVFGV